MINDSGSRLDLVFPCESESPLKSARFPADRAHLAEIILHIVSSLDDEMLTIETVQSKNVIIWPRPLCAIQSHL